MYTQIRRRRVNRPRLGGSAISSITYTKSEPYALCFYLYALLDNKPNNQIMEDYGEAITCFFNCVSLLNMTDRLTTVLQTEVVRLEKQNELKPLADLSREGDCFDNSTVPYYYEQDKFINRKIDEHDEIDENMVNIHRILFTVKKPIFSTIINTTVFKKGTNYRLSESLTISPKVEKAIFDIEKTQFLVDQVNLSENEARFILMQCRFCEIVAFVKLTRHQELYDTDYRKRLSMILGITEAEFRSILRTDNKLKSYGFMDDNDEYDSALNECIVEQTISPYFTDLLKPLDCSEAYELDSFSVKPESTEICLDLLKGKSPVSILFYGKPGSGKTELAKALGKHSGKEVYIFRNETENRGRPLMGTLGRLVCLLSMERTDSILIVDEADTILKTLDFSFFGPVPTSSKGIVNKMLENNQDKVIYIINHQHQIDDSTLRRFNFSIKFDSMPATMLRSIAQTKLEPMTIADSTKAALLNLFDKYHLTGASVDNIVKMIDGMECTNEETLLHKAQIVMKENSTLINGKSKIRDTVSPEYDPKVLNATIEPEKIVEMVQNALQYAEKNKGTESGIRMLFYGLSGTGKTELARYIADKLGKNILLKRASDILGMYVGQNEKNICNAFAEAENSGAILLFDEADSFFGDRNQAHHSWERTTVNEFLTQMEEFSGILICTTNLRSIMDPAMQRRFHLLVEFKPMKFEGIKTMAERYFPNYQFLDSQLKSLENMESLTPGDFGSLSSRIRFMNPADISSQYIVDELKKLQVEKKEGPQGSSPKIGFPLP